MAPDLNEAENLYPPGSSDQLIQQDQFLKQDGIRHTIKVVEEESGNCQCGVVE